MTTLMDEMKAISALTEAERALLAELQPSVERHAAEIVEQFYAHLQRFERLHAILNAEPGRVERLHAILNAEPGRVERLKAHLKQWLLSLAQGVYDERYYERRYRIGKRHVEVGLEPRYVIAAMAFCRATAAQTIVMADYAADPRREALMQALNRIMDIDLNIMLQSYDDHRVYQFLEVTGFSRELFDNLMSGLL